MSGAGSVAMIFLVLAVVGIGALLFKDKLPFMAGTGNGDGVGDLTVANCPDDGDSVLTLDAYNTENDTAASTYDTELTIKGRAGHRLEGTDSTTGSYTLNCLETYDLTIESADAANGDNSKIVKILEGVDAKLNADGTVTFTPKKSGYTLKVGVPQHATLEFKAYDRSDARYAYSDDDASNTDWEADGVTYRDGDNATAFALAAAGDEIDILISARSIQTDTEFCDNYCLIAIESPTTEYDTPVVKFEGSTLTDVKGDLDENEEKGLAGYEFIYKVMDVINHDGKDVSFVIEATGDASTDLQVDFIAAGKTDSINGIDILTTAYTDAASPAAVYAVQDITIDVS